MLTWGAFTFWMKVFALAQMTDCWCLIGCCWNCAAALIGLSSAGQTIYCLEFHSKFHVQRIQVSVSSLQVCWKAWKVSGSRVGPPQATIPRTSIHHCNHTPHTSHGARERRRLELKSIKLQYISRPYKEAWTDTRPRKNCSNINQVIENLCGWFEASWFITPSQISLRLWGCSLQRRREYQFPR